jgi:pimeloyl-ACP methyl ester carboxylesterase
MRFGAPGATPLVFSHANGFCASAYRQALSAIRDHDVFAIDLRGHGRSQLPCAPARGPLWRRHANDIAASLDAIRRDFSIGAPAVLGGHSLGAVASAMAAAGRSDIAALRLIEPVATPEQYRYLAMTPLWGLFADAMPLARAARRRRPHFGSRADAAAAYAGKSLFRRFAPGALDDYLDDGLTEDAGGFRLSCPPSWEAANFTATDNDFWSAVRRRTAPLAVLAADDASSTLFADAPARLHRHGAVVRLESGVSHLLPMEAPERAARFLATGE